MIGTESNGYYNQGSLHTSIALSCDVKLFIFILRESFQPVEKEDV